MYKHFLPQSDIFRISPATSLTLSLLVVKPLSCHLLCLLYLAGAIKQKNHLKPFSLIDSVELLLILENKMPQVSIVFYKIIARLINV